MLNALSELDFQDAFKKWQKHQEQCICMNRDYFDGDSGQ
jgi:hypothetical protein